MVVSVLRRMFIPPTLDTFVDIVIHSIFDVVEHEDDAVLVRQSIWERVNQHWEIVDSVHFYKVSNMIYTNLIKEKANALLLDKF